MGQAPRAGRGESGNRADHRVLSGTLAKFPKTWGLSSASTRTSAGASNPTPICEASTPNWGSITESE
jgi:hypothetical protein